MARFLFMDFETQSDLDLTITGTLKYVLDTSTRVLCLSYGIDDDEIVLWVPGWLADELDPEVWAYVESRAATIGDEILPLLTAFVGEPGNYTVAWNMGFDRNVWQQVASADNNFPRVEIEQTLDAMSQAQASNLPGALDWAGRKIGLGEKTIGGKAIMKRFADRSLPLPGSKADIANAETAAFNKGGDIEAMKAARVQAVKDAIEAWRLYLDYAVQDTALMRDIWRATRPLSAEEWAEYWVSERINDRGMMVDLDVCRGAVVYREEENAFIAAECQRITGGAIASPTLTKQINEWIFARLPEALQGAMIRGVDEETGEVTRLTGAKDVLGRLLEDIKASDLAVADDVVELLELLQFGRSSSAVKFEKMLNQEVDGRLTGLYVFNGAGQTGRYSSRAIQAHNLPRDFFENELDLLDMVAAQVPIEQLREYGPVTSVLSKLIRPTILAPEKRMLVWGDWSAIEARVVAWLANSRAAEQHVLEVYRRDEDLYLLNAAAIFNTPLDTLTERYRDGDKEAKGMRQAGKVAVLALGYLGGVGALKAMARNYGLRLTDEQAQIIVDGWRKRNRWARAHGEAVKKAMFDAIKNPLAKHNAGRVTYQFLPQLMGGTLISVLPCGRPLMYPMTKIETIERFGKPVPAITYLNGMGRSVMWEGLAVENNTQGLAASILRATLTRIEEEEKMGILVGHTHDEIIEECDEDNASAVESRLAETMTRGFSWTKGLPLAVETKVSYYYTKAD